MIQNKTALATALLLTTALTACNGKGGFATGLTLDPLNGKVGTSPGDSSGGESSAFQKLQYKGYFASGNDTGKLAVDLDKENGALLLILPLQLNIFIEALEGEISELPGVKFTTHKDSKGASYLAVSVPLRYVLKGAGFLPPARLPNGDALPQVAGGELPSIALKIPGKNNVQFHFYVGLDTVCLYVSSPFNPHLPMTFPIRNNLETIGYLTSVPAKGTYDGGFFLSTQLPNSVARILDDHFQF